MAAAEAQLIAILRYGAEGISRPLCVLDVSRVGVTVHATSPGGSRRVGGATTGNAEDSQPDQGLGRGVAARASCEAGVGA